MGPQQYDALRKQVMARFGLAAFMVPVLLYAMAGTLHYWQGWLYWAVLSIPMLAASFYFLKTDPKLLERRMRSKEKEPQQRTIIFFSNAVFLVGFAAVGYDLRHHGLNQLPISIVIAADAGVLLGYGLILWVLRENSYAARTIEVDDDQKIITTGPYSIVRHPMYLGFMIMLLLTPLSLGSWRALPIFLLYIPVIVWRIFNEEKVLLRGLPGYREYYQKKRYRLLPFVW